MGNKICGIDVPRLWSEGDAEQARYDFTPHGCNRESAKLANKRDVYEIVNAFIKLVETQSQLSVAVSFTQRRPTFSFAQEQ